MFASLLRVTFFFFNDTATTEIYTLSLHDALPISPWTSARSRATSGCSPRARVPDSPRSFCPRSSRARASCPGRSEEHTSELQSQSNLVCRLLLEKKKTVHHLLHHDRYQPCLLMLR